MRRTTRIQNRRSRYARRAVVGVGAAGLLLASTVATAKPVVSGPHFFHATGTSLFPVAVADFNKDGRQDIVVGSEDNATVSVLYGKKGGGFKSNQDYPGGSYPFAIATADFNHDGRLDIAVGNDDTPGTVVVLLSKHGGFRSPDTYTVGDDVYMLAIADFNHDGNADIAAANEGSDSISILLGRHNGTFKRGRKLSTDFEPVSVVAGDFNHKGGPDLAVLNYRSGSNPSVQVFLGKGNGKFNSPKRYKVHANDPEGMVAGQFTADHNIDLAVPGCQEAAPNKVSLLDGTSKGTFKAPRTFKNVPSSCSYVSAAVDLNHDGRTDLVTAIDDTPHHGDISVMLGKKGGKLSKPKLYKATPAADNYSIAVGRFNGDTKPDLVVPDYDNPRVAVLYGKG